MRLGRKLRLLVWWSSLQDGNCRRKYFGNDNILVALLIPFKMVYMSGQDVTLFGDFDGAIWGIEIVSGMARLIH